MCRPAVISMEVLIQVSGSVPAGEVRSQTWPAVISVEVLIQVSGSVPAGDVKMLERSEVKPGLEFGEFWIELNFS